MTLVLLKMLKGDESTNKKKRRKWHIHIKITRLQLRGMLPWLLFALAIVAFVVAGWLITPTLGLIVFGVGLLYTAWAVVPDETQGGADK